MNSKTVLWTALIALSVGAAAIVAAHALAQEVPPESIPSIAVPPPSAPPPASGEPAPARTDAARPASGGTLTGANTSSAGPRSAASGPVTAKSDGGAVSVYDLKTSESPFVRGGSRFSSTYPAADAAEGDAQSLLATYTKSTDEKARAETRAALTKVLERQFDLRQKAAESEVAQLEAQVQRLRDLIQKRQQARQEIVQKRLDQVLREAEGLGWPAPTSGGRGPYSPAVWSSSPKSSAAPSQNDAPADPTAVYRQMIDDAKSYDALRAPDSTRPTPGKPPVAR